MIDCKFMLGIHDNHNKKMVHLDQSSSNFLLPSAQKLTRFQKEEDILMRFFLTYGASLYEV